MSVFLHNAELIASFLLFPNRYGKNMRILFLSMSEFLFWTGGAALLLQVVKVKKLIDSGRIGEIYLAKANYWESTIT